MLTAVMALLVGALCVISAYKDYDWFFDSSKASFFVKLMGRNGARVFYGVAGVIIMIVGFAMIMNGA